MKNLHSIIGLNVGWADLGGYAVIDFLSLVVF